jgi:hypothetical protein
MASSGSVSRKAQIDESPKNCTDALFNLGFGFKKFQIAINPYVAFPGEVTIQEIHGFRADVIRSAACIIGHVKYLFDRYGYKGHIVI